MTSGVYLSGEHPHVTKVDGVPTSVKVRVFDRENSVLVAETTSGQDGTWLVDELDPAKKYDIIFSAEGYRDIIVSDVNPAVNLDPYLDPYWDNVVALLHFDGNFTDETGRSWSAVGSPTFVPSEAGFGQQFHPNLTSYGSTPQSNALGLTSGEFTVELFITLTTGNKMEAIVSKRGTGTNNLGWEVTISENGRVNFLATGRDWTPASSNASPLNQGRNHIAICRYANNTAKLFINGEVAHLWTTAQSPGTSTAPLIVGRGANANFLRPSDSYIDELRITKDVARYTEDFTPPDKPFPNRGH